jgi:hypothetical protein
MPSDHTSSATTGDILLEALTANLTHYWTISLSPIGGSSVERSLAKDIIEIPVPNEDQIGIDIGFASGDQINVETVFGDGWGPGSNYAILFDLVKYRAAGTIVDWKLHIGGSIYYFVSIKNLSATLNSGEGDRVQCRINFGIIKQQ